MSPEAWDAVKNLAVVIGIIAFVYTVGWNTYQAFVGRRKDRRAIAQAADAAREKLRQDADAARDRLREELDEYAKKEDLRQLQAIVNDTRERVIVVQTQIAPFWRMVESSILPRVNVPNNLNPITEEQRKAMAMYVELKDKTPKKALYAARAGFGIEIAENKNLDPDSVLFYSLAYGAANARIADIESAERSANAQ